MVKIRGIYAITDESLIRDDELEFAVEKAIQGGASMIQLRDKNFSFQKKVERARRVLKITRNYGIPLIINDDPMVMLESNADGVHLGEEEYYWFPYIRSFPKIVGISCYNSLERAKFFERMGADYVAFGSVFPTSTKKVKYRVSVEVIRRAKSILNIPIVAIGGINEQSMDSIVEFVDAIAVISAVFKGDSFKNTRKLKQKFDKLKCFII